MPRQLGHDSFVIRRAPLVQNPRDNTFFRDWDNATETTITGAQVQAFRLSEKLNFEITKEREFSRTVMRFFCPPDTDVESTDQIIYRNQEYTVFGHLSEWTNLHGELDHVAFLARRREG